MDPLIKIDHLTFNYPGFGSDDQPVINDLSLEIKAGEFVAIVGANGSGKTTLARHLNGLLVPTIGRVLVGGCDTKNPSDILRVRAEVGMVFQSPEEQIIASIVEEDVAFGPENMGLSSKEIRERVDDALKTVGMWEQRLRPPHMLSAGQMQRIALAGVLAMRPRILIFDEATSMLDPVGRRMVIELMQQLNREGLTIITVTHFMDEAAQASRVVALRHGHIVLDGPPSEVFSDRARLINMGLDLPPSMLLANVIQGVVPNIEGWYKSLDELLAAIPNYKDSLAVGVEQGLATDCLVSCPDTDLLAEVEGLHHVYLAGTPMEQHSLEGVTLHVAAGEIHSLIGATGSGKSTLLQHINGLLRPQEGRVRVGPFDLNDPQVDIKLLRRSVGMVFQNPELYIFEQYVGDEVAYGPRLLFPDERPLARVRQAMEAVGLDFELYKDRPTFALSGGERRKVALASALAVEPNVLLLDEPTAGLDPAARKELLVCLRKLNARGVTLIISSHRMEDVAVLSGRLTVMADGRDVRRGSPAEIFRQIEYLESLGLEPPPSTHVAEVLQRKGWPIPLGILSLDELEMVMKGWHNEQL